MNHDEAIRLKAAEKYLLGELSTELRDEYEDHYFGCAECALDVQTGAVFIDNARDVLSSSSVADIGAKRRPVRSGGWWTALLWPAFAVPVLAHAVVFSHHLAPADRSGVDGIVPEGAVLKPVAA